MSETENKFQEIANLDRLIHDPSRLAIMTVLSTCEEADFTYLLNMTGLTKGNLSSHVSKLEENNLLKVRKTYKLKKPITYIRLTNEGTAAIKKHWHTLDELKKRALDE